jgi:hypothetical protein
VMRGGRLQGRFVRAATRPVVAAICAFLCGEFGKGGNCGNLGN